MGLHLDEFIGVDDGVRAIFRPRAEYAGFDDTLHGGIVATALDEASAWAALHVHGALVFTAKLEIRYRREARTSTDYSVEATIAERRGRRMTIDAAMRDGDGAVATSSGLFIVAEAHTADLTGQENGITTISPSAT